MPCGGWVFRGCRVRAWKTARGGTRRAGRGRPAVDEFMREQLTDQRAEGRGTVHHSRRQARNTRDRTDGREAIGRNGPRADQTVRETQRFGRLKPRLHTLDDGLCEFRISCPASKAPEKISPIRIVPSGSCRKCTSGLMITWSRMGGWGWLARISPAAFCMGRSKPTSRSRSLVRNTGGEADLIRPMLPQRGSDADASTRFDQQAIDAAAQLIAAPSPAAKSSIQRVMSASATPASSGACRARSGGSCTLGASAAKRLASTTLQR